MSHETAWRIVAALLTVAFVAALTSLILQLGGGA